MISAMETKIAAMKIATATFPRCSSAGKSTSGVSRSIDAIRHEHQHDADDRVQHVDGDDGELHGASR